MLRSKLELALKKDIINLLKNCGFIDGENLSQSNNIQNQDVAFWNNILENSKQAKNSSYIVYSIQSYADKIFGDGRDVLQRCYCNIDLFTNHGNESRNTYELRRAIEEAFNQFPWYIDFNLHEYDAQNKLNHYSYTVSNIYGDKDEESEL